jgi:hypothetical protein
MIYSLLLSLCLAAPQFDTDVYLWTEYVNSPSLQPPVSASSFLHGQSASKTASGLTEGITFCWKRTLNRPYSFKKPCPEGSDVLHGFGVCYPKCPVEYDGFGPGKGACLSETNSKGICRVIGRMIHNYKILQNNTKPLNNTDTIKYDSTIHNMPTNPLQYAISTANNLLIPVCWSKCPLELSYSCGGSCTKSADDCTSSLFTQVSVVAEVVYNVASAVTGQAMLPISKFTTTTTKTQLVKELKTMVTDQKFAQDLGEEVPYER